MCVCSAALQGIAGDEAGEEKGELNLSDSFHLACKIMYLNTGFDSKSRGRARVLYLVFKQQHLPAGLN